MGSKIIIEKRTYSNLVKLVIETRKLLLELSERPEFNKEWMSITDVESEFGLTRKVIGGYRDRGLKVNQKKVGGKILIRRNDLEKFILKK